MANFLDTLLYAPTVVVQLLLDGVKFSLNVGSPGDCTPVTTDTVLGSGLIIIDCFGYMVK